MDRQQRSYPNDNNPCPPILARIPPEIACQIFEYACERIGDVKNTGTMRITISHVCRDWRYTALAHARMWASFSYTATSQNNFRPPVDLLKLHLVRSGVQPLDIFLDVSREEVEPKRAMEIIKAIIPYVRFWRTIDIYTNYNTITNDLFDSLVGVSAPELKALTFHRDSLLESFPATSPRILLGGAPKLTFLHMDSLGPWTFLPPLSGITSLILGGISYHDISLHWSFILHLLQQPALSSLSLYHISIDLREDESAWGRPILMNNLTHLRLSDSTDVTEALPWLEAPRLRFLEHYDLAPPRLAPFRNAFLALDTLLFEIPPTSDHADLFWNLSQQAPNLTHLIILVPKARTLQFVSDKISEWRASNDPPGTTDPLMWPALQRVTLNLGPFTRVMEALQFVWFLLPNRRAPRLTVALDPRHITDWRRCEPTLFGLLEECCVVVSWDFEELVRERSGWESDAKGVPPRLVTRYTASLFKLRPLYH